MAATIRDEPPPVEMWVSDKVAVAPSAIDGQGLYATADLDAGTVVIRLAGRLVSSAELAEILGSAQADGGSAYVDTITVFEDRHLVLPSGSVVHFSNHSCDPNLWHVGPFAIAARRNVGSGEELTVDYATSSGAPGFSMGCRCRSPLCRGEVSSEDWRRPELQERYGGHWTPALDVRISSL
jgi:uncharacterized protein